MFLIYLLLAPFGALADTTTQSELLIETDASVHPNTTIVNRGMFSSQLAKALGYNTKLVSEFPVFRDVELNHPDYAAIEALRERGFLHASEDGYFYPQKPLSRLEAFTSLANAFHSIAMTPEQAALILTNYSIDTELNQEQTIGLARLLQEDIIHFNPVSLLDDGEKKTTKTALNLSEPLDSIALASLIERARYKTTNANSLSSRNVENGLADLPSNLTLELSPTQAIFEQDLSVGDTFYFISNQDVTVTAEEIAQLRPDKNILADLVLLPKGTRFRARVVEKITDHLWTFRFNQAQTPNNYFYRTKGLLPILFSAKLEKAFITPGQLFQVTTTEVTSGNKIAQSILEKMIQQYQKQEKTIPSPTNSSSKKWSWELHNPFQK